MPALQMGLTRHLNANHQSAPLLLQFLLAEFFQVLQQFGDIKHLIGKEQHDHLFFALLARFSGPSPDRMKISYWNPDNGTLSKFYFYAAFLSDLAPKISPHFPPLERNCRRCWMLGTHLHASIVRGRKEETTIILEKLQQTLRNAGKELVVAIALLKESENVLYFLLRHREQIDSIYGDSFTVRLLEGFFPEGLEGAQEFLVSRYTERGFGKLINTIRHHFSGLL